MNIWHVVYIIALLAVLKAAVRKRVTGDFSGVIIDPYLVGFILIVTAVLWWFGFFKGMF
ncbi:hypothetical protein [Atopobium minutum]|uniref:hypothetical protein n=1 Tax=Atopobium minutum TaxID=1381 RepID=UPI00280BB7C5|nr:hypothetical protein [Atopobium minutum]